MNLENWQPYTPKQIANLLPDLNVPYWIAGGFALEIFVGRNYREHTDLDIVIRRDDQHIFRHHLSDYAFFAAAPPGKLRVWPKDERLPKLINDVWVKEQSEGPFVFQIMFLETDGEYWVYRRDTTIRGHLHNFGLVTKDGFPIIAPHIQLLYKAHRIRPKDKLDFDTCLAYLSKWQKSWLATTLKKVYGKHPWLNQLENMV